MKVRSVAPSSPSLTLGEVIESEGGSSSSVIVSVRDDGAVTPCEFAAEPDTVTLSSGSSVASPVAVIVTVPVLLVRPAAMVRVFSALSAKSPAPAVVPAAETVIVVSALEARFSEAVTVEELAAPLSVTEVRERASVAVGFASSSVIVRVTAAGAVTPCEFAAAPDTVTLRFGSSVSSSTAVIVTVPVLLVAPAAMVSVFSALREKSAASAPEPGAAETVISVSALDGRSSEAVTVVEFVAPLSGILGRDSARVTVGFASSSVMVPVPVAVPMVAFTAPLNSTATVSFGSSVVSPVSETVIVLLVSPAAKVRVPPLIAL